jgi:hypothetical protein
LEAIMHLNAMDCAFEISSRLFEDENTMQIVGRWICLGYCGQPWSISTLEVLTIVKKHEWVFLSDEVLRTPRTCPGLPTKAEK